YLRISRRERYIHNIFNLPFLRHPIFLPIHTFNLASAMLLAYKISNKSQNVIRISSREREKDLLLQARIW
ncbi:MAG: hypothetical protein MJE68_06570, partial [Proteobacteria bacterium]|nr:hypothetical protein [Pseudomonadota bacterium]